MQYRAEFRSLKKHEAPDWFHDAKLGVMVTWGPYSVPAYAPTGMGDIVEIIRRKGVRYLYANQPYSEWYLNSLRIPGSPVERHHAETYGKNYPYREFGHRFNSSLGDWDPAGWARLFASAHARYVVLVTKHADGFLLWPSRRLNPVIEGWVAARDVVGELTSAVGEAGMRMGLYYSSALDWSLTDRPMMDTADLIAGGPATREYAGYVDFHWRELIDRYRPSILWGDIGYPPGGALPELFAFYYNRMPDGLVNDRWSQVGRLSRWIIRTPPGRAIAERAARRMFIKGRTGLNVPHCDYITPEYVNLPGISEKKWECVRGIGRSFAYNKKEREEDYSTPEELVHLLVDVVSKNGNLLLGVGPRADGGILAPQRVRLEELGEWLSVNGEAIFGTLPWSRAEGLTAGGLGVRFTRKGDNLYATVLGVPVGRDLIIRSLVPRPGSRLLMVGSGVELTWERQGEDAKIRLPSPLRAKYALSIRISPPPAR